MLVKCEIPFTPTRVSPTQKGLTPRQRDIYICSVTFSPHLLDYPICIFCPPNLHADNSLYQIDLSESCLQSLLAFIKDRLLLENVLVASEVLQEYHLDSSSPRLKLLFQRRLIQFVGILFSLPFKRTKFLQLSSSGLKACICTPSFSISLSQILVILFGLFYCQIG